MNTTQLSEFIRVVLTQPTGGIVGLVDELLGISSLQDIHLSWQAGSCRVRFLEGEIEVPLRRSVVRAILARVAVLCNQQKPNSVSPYGGQSELLIHTPDRTTFLRVAFINTPDEQSMELRRIPAFIHTPAVDPSPLSPPTSSLVAGRQLLQESAQQGPDDAGTPRSG